MEFELSAPAIVTLEQGHPIWIVINDKMYKIHPETKVSNHGLERVERLKKRMRWLEGRLSAEPNLTFDAAELAALQWALKILGKYYGEQFI